MKAGVVHAKDDIVYEEVETPVPGKGELLVEVKYTGICGSDIPRVNGDASHFYPNILGHEFSGVVADKGEGVNNFEIGDSVAGIPLLPCMSCDDCNRGDFSLCKNYKFIGSSVFGSFANYVCIPAKNAVKFSADVDYKTAAFFEPATVSMHGVKRVGIGPDSQDDVDQNATACILGAGTIGIFLLQWLRIFGIKNVDVCDIATPRLELAKKLGARNCINSANISVSEIRDQYSDGHGYDYMFESAGNTVTMRMAFGLAANHARVCFVGTPTSELKFSIAEWENINRREFYLTGSWMSYSSPFPGNEWSETAKHFGDGSLVVDESFIYKTLPLSQIADAFEEFKTPGQVKGKFLIDCQA